MDAVACLAEHARTDLYQFAGPPSVTDLYLIAHKVRGQPAFDVAEKTTIAGEEAWIVSTSGHRAWPWWSVPLDEVEVMSEEHYDPPMVALSSAVPPMPPDIRDHFSINRPTPIKLEELDI